MTKTNEGDKVDDPNPKTEFVEGKKVNSMLIWKYTQPFPAKSLYANNSFF